MSTVERCEALPDGAYLEAYVGGPNYTDCFACRLPRPAPLERCLLAFLTTPVFRVERVLLSLAFSSPSTNAEAEQLARGERQAFSAWRVERRDDGQILLADRTGRTRTWLMVRRVEGSDAGTARCVLYFGSAVLPGEGGQTERRNPGLAMAVLLLFHRFYSRALLGATQRRLQDAAHGEAAH